MSRHRDRLALTAAALYAAGRGWPVFPVEAGGKRPAVPDHIGARCTGLDPRCRGGHQGWQERATTDQGRIRRGWTVQPFNVGVACGPAGLVVVDLDMPKPGEAVPRGWRMPGVETGEDVLAVLAERAGQPLAPLYDTYTVITGRGGRHLYFAAPAGRRLTNSAGALGWLVDTRAAGGYVLASGSVVKGGRYTVGADLPLAPLPDWLADRLAQAAPPPRPAAPLATGTGRRGAYLAAAIDRERARVAMAGEGGRNHALYLAAVALGQLAAGGALTPEQVTAELEQAAAPHLAARAFTPAGARSTIASGLRAGARRPRPLAA